MIQHGIDCHLSGWAQQSSQPRNSKPRLRRWPTWRFLRQRGPGAPLEGAWFLLADRPSRPIQQGSQAPRLRCRRYAPRGGTISNAAIGQMASDVKLAAETRAACRGRARVDSRYPSSSRRWALRRSRELSCSATFLASSPSSPSFRRSSLARHTRRLGSRSSLLFECDIGLFYVALRAHGHVFAGSHRHCARHDSCHSGHEDCIVGRRRCCNANHQAGRRDDSVISSKNRSAQPSATTCAMRLHQMFRPSPRSGTLADSARGDRQ